MPGDRAAAGGDSRCWSWSWNWCSTCAVHAPTPTCWPPLPPQPPHPSNHHDPSTHPAPHPTPHHQQLVRAAQLLVGRLLELRHEVLRFCTAGAAGTAASALVGPRHQSTFPWGGWWVVVVVCGWGGVGWSGVGWGGVGWGGVGFIALAFTLGFTWRSTRPPAQAGPSQGTPLRELATQAPPLLVFRVKMNC